MDDDNSSGVPSVNAPKARRPEGAREPTSPFQGLPNRVRLSDGAVAQAHIIQLVRAGPPLWWAFDISGFSVGGLQDQKPRRIGTAADKPATPLRVAPTAKSPANWASSCGDPGIVDGFRPRPGGRVVSAVPGTIRHSLPARGECHATPAARVDLPRGSGRTTGRATHPAPGPTGPTHIGGSYTNPDTARRGGADAGEGRRARPLSAGSSLTARTEPAQRHSTTAVAAPSTTGGYPHISPGASRPDCHGESSL